jgi:hypothetical protein
MYGFGNPAKFVDPSGHDPWSCEGGPCFTAGAGGLPPDDDDDGPGIEPVNEDLANALNLTGAVLDLSAWAVSLVGIFEELGLTVLATSEVGPAGPLIGLVSYKETLDVVEYMLSYGGFGCSAAADYYGGYTYLDTDNTRYGLPEWVIGEDTVRDFVAQAIGRLVPEAIVDFGLNTIQGWYSWNSLVQDPTWELRIVVGRIPFDQPPTDWYIKNYGKDK